MHALSGFRLTAAEVWEVTGCADPPSSRRATVTRREGKGRHTGSSRARRLRSEPAFQRRRLFEAAFEPVCEPALRPDLLHQSRNLRQGCPGPRECAEQQWWSSRVLFGVTGSP